NAFKFTKNYFEKLSKFPNKEKEIYDLLLPLIERLSREFWRVSYQQEDKQTNLSPSFSESIKDFISKKGKLTNLKPHFKEFLPYFIALLGKAFPHFPKDK